MRGRPVWRSAAGEARLNVAAALWREGRSLDEIARAIGCSRNVIAGLAHRHRERFPARGAPAALIGRSGRSGAPRDAAAHAAFEAARAAARADQARARRNAKQVAALAALPVVRVPSPFRTCQWMDGDPRVDATRCGASCLDGLSWCAAHAVRVYARPVAIAAGEAA
jgi:hypothetical protein